MIIACNNCKKKFNINADLIPKKGRLLQCSSCDHQWFFKEETIQNTKDLASNATNNYTNEHLISHEDKNNLENNKNFSEKEDSNQRIGGFHSDGVKKIKGKSKIFKLTLIFIISFTSLIILIDTFKYPISKVVPNIEFMLYSLYESILDVKLFFLDLIQIYD